MTEMSSLAQIITPSDDTRSSFVYRWSVTELQNLSYDGDYNGLAQYVESLVEYFCDFDTTDLEALRKHMRIDLVDFIGAASAHHFSEGLVKHLVEHPDFLNQGPNLDKSPPASSSENEIFTHNRTIHRAVENVDRDEVYNVNVPASTTTSTLNMVEIDASVSTVKPAEVISPTKPVNPTKVNSYINPIATTVTNPAIINFTNVDSIIAHHTTASHTSSNDTNCIDVTNCISVNHASPSIHADRADQTSALDYDHLTKSISIVDTADVSGADKTCLPFFIQRDRQQFFQTQDVLYC